MERADRAPLAGVFAPVTLAAGATVVLDEDAAHHLRVRRVAEGDGVRATDGAGALAVGVLARLGRRDAALEVHAVSAVPPPPPVTLLAPVADRDRMLLLAEKACELGLTSWRPVRWQRSRSVSPRGEGEAFAAKVRARMIAALLQSGGAWLPAVGREVEVGALAPADGERALLLDAAGTPLLALAPHDGPLLLAVGPEGGVEAAERDRLCGAGFAPASLGAGVLRFETAAIVALGALHAARAAGATLTLAAQAP